MKRLVFSLYAALALSAVGSMQAATQDPRVALEGKVVEWAGSGPNTAFVVIDFDASTTGSAEFAFGVQFTSPTITGIEALEILADATSVELTSTVYSFGTSIDAIEYTRDGETYYRTYAYDYSEFWNYYASADSGVTWEMCSIGASDRILSDGDVDGWHYDAWGASPPNGPRVLPASTLPLEREVVEWAGCGERSAFVVVDFDLSTTDSVEFVFGVNFTSPTITGAEALHILHAETSLRVTGTSYGYDTFVDSIEYTHNGETYVSTGTLADETYWAINNMRGADEWAYASTGIEGRTLHHGDVDGYQFLGWYDFSTGPNGPVTGDPPQDILVTDAIDWVGAGERVGYVVIDFDKSTTDSREFVFGVRFDCPTITGEDALQLLMDEAGLEITSTTYSFGTFIDSVTYEYEGETYTATGSFATSTYWSAWISRDYGAAWDYGLVGISDRMFHHADVDGYQFLGYSDFTSGPNGPRQLPPVVTRARIWRWYE
ncbi:hypothetical protein JXA32_15385 [Candidatus Sumerlaeota bacterium]|nr:hypothetical protein [Candidatus Sumerlaeota bacterium]